jgi:hypothetical protein
MYKSIPLIWSKKLNSIYTIKHLDLYINILESKCLKQTFIRMNMKANGTIIDNSKGTKLWHKKSKFY